MKVNFKTSKRKLHARETHNPYQLSFNQKFCRLEESGMVYSNTERKKNLQASILYPARLSFRTEKERDKEFLRQTDVKGIRDHNLALQNMLKGTLSGKERKYHRKESRKPVKIKISIKISQGTHKIKDCKVGHCISKM